MNKKTAILIAVASVIVAFVITWALVQIVKDSNERMIVLTIDYGYDEMVITNEMKFGSTYKLEGNPIRNGYTFSGWYTDSTFETVFSNTTKITKDMTIYAKWIAN